MTTQLPELPVASESKGNHVLLPGQKENGKPILSVLLKRTYAIDSAGQCIRAESDNPLIPGDVPWDHPLNSPTKFESDFVPYKLATDVVLNGSVYAPPNVVCTKLIAALQIGDIRKEVLVLGDRSVICDSGTNINFSEPEAFQVMPLKYDLAYGGIDVYSHREVQYPYPRNTAGRGFVVSNSRQALAKVKLPNLEDPRDRLTPDRLCVGDYLKNWAQQPMPCSFGWFSKSWHPRVSFAGVMPGDRAIEQQLRAAYSKLVPAAQQEAYLKTNLPDMDFRFFNGASPGLSFPFLRGDETIKTEFLTPEGNFTFRLPADLPSIGIDIGQGVTKTDVVMQTVMVHMDQRKVDLVWRGAIEYAGLDWLPEMKHLQVVIS